MRTSARAVSTQTFTVIHGGADIAPATVGELIAVASAWTASAEPGTRRVVELWVPSWNRVLASLLAAAAAIGGPCYVGPLPVADELIAGLRARGVAVHHRPVRPSTLVEAELRAIASGSPIRYI